MEVGLSVPLNRIPKIAMNDEQNNVNRITSLIRIININIFIESVLKGIIILSM